MQSFDDKPIMDKPEPIKPDLNTSPHTEENPEKKYAPIFKDSQEFIKGRGGLEDKLTRFLRENPDKLQELNKKLYNARLPQVYHKDIPEAAKKIIERRFSPRVTADNKITLQEIKSPREEREELREDLGRRVRSTPDFKEDQIIDEFFDDLIDK